VPLLVGVFTVPVLLRTLGVERLGVLAIAWLIVGYSGLLDLGLSRSITQIVAANMSLGRSHKSLALLWTALYFSGFLSVLGTALAWGFTSPLLHALNVSPELREEVLVSLRVFCFSIPPVILASILLGFLTAYERFGLINAIKIPTGVLMTAGPILSVAFGSHSLVPVMSILVGARWITLMGFAWAARRVEPSILTRPRYEAPLLRQLLKLGTWITISSVVSPMLVYCDRFLIGSLLSLSAVAYYTTPQDTITKLLALPIAFVAVLYPYIARQDKTDRSLCVVQSQETLTQTFIMLFPVIAVVVVFSQQGMTLWLGAEFAAQSYRLLQVFAIGVLINGLAQVPATILQGIGKPEWPALIHLAELLLYIPASFFAIKYFGLLGASLAWAGRITLDALALAWAVRKAWGRGSFLPLRCLLPQLILISLLSLYLGIANERHPVVFILLVLSVFSVLYHRRILALGVRTWAQIVVHTP
jgi:O-antigen/teichoic acid export membrane protein